jgi:PAS domain S-box-containing protein
MGTPPSYEVVLVDDAEDVRAVVGRYLRLSGRFEIVGEGRTGADAVALAERHQPHMLVLDASMPEMDGLEALPHIRSVAAGTKVVMLSGFSGRTLEAAARELGAAAFVEKAAPIEELADCLLGVMAGEEPPVRPEPVANGVPAASEDSVMAQHLERFRTVFDQAAIGMATMTLSGTVVRANAALLELTGQDEAALVGRRYPDFAPDQAGAAVQRAVRDVSRGTVGSAEVEHLLAGTPTPTWIRSTVTAVRDTDSRPLYLFVQAEDITDRRQALAALRTSEDSFRLLVEGVQDYAIFMLDPEGHISTWNLGAERMKGYTADEIIGQHFRVFYPQEAQEVKHPEHELEIAVLDGRYEEEGWRIRKDGTRFWANVVITALFDPDRRLVGFGKVTRDVTGRRMAEAESERVAAALVATNEQLLAANEQTTDFLAITAHELRSPISALTGAAQIIDQYWDQMDATDRQENMDNLVRSARRTQRLLDELLTASRLEVGSLEYDPAAVALTPLLREAAAATDLGGEHVKVHSGGDLTVWADRTRVVQMAANLIANALKYGVEPVVVEASETPDGVEVRVLDHGAGPGPELAERLFSKFSRGARPGGGGTGLGLFIVRELARAQGGEASYRREGDRTCFAFWLPAAAPDPG